MSNITPAAQNQAGASAPVVPSLVRTFGTFLATYLIQLGADQWTGLSVSQVTMVTIFALGYLWYVLVRLVEQKFPQFGWLLLLAKAPVAYAKEPAAVAVVPDKVSTINGQHSGDTGA